MTDKLLPTTLVGSYVQPEWLVDRSNLKGRLPPPLALLLQLFPAPRLSTKPQALTSCTWTLLAFFSCLEAGPTSSMLPHFWRQASRSWLRMKSFMSFHPSLRGFFFCVTQITDHVWPRRPCVRKHFLKDSEP